MVAALVRLARERRARTLAIGSGRAPYALETARRLEAAWQQAGGTILANVTWPETGASWLRQATRFAAAAPDLWVMTGPALGWAQMTRRLLWSTPWSPERTLAMAEIGEPGTLALVGLVNLNGLTGTTTDGRPWRVEDDMLRHPAPTGSVR
ncbi:hypothetical protein [Streptomyces sp. NPDC048659]|uniref:hypothetical protein n=1 Tax=Streptomyces sp. NPDC048659 TaxID=3155489 RepID=UPI0034392B7F